MSHWKGMKPEMLLTKAKEVSYQNDHWTQKHQALLEFLRKEDKHKMEILDAGVSFANSIVPMLHSPAAKKKKKPTCKNRNAAGLNEIRI